MATNVPKLPILSIETCLEMFGKVRRTSNPNVEHLEHVFGQQKPNVEHAEHPQKTRTSNVEHCSFQHYSVPSVST